MIVAMAVMGVVKPVAVEVVDMVPMRDRLLPIRLPLVSDMLF